MENDLKELFELDNFASVNFKHDKGYIIANEKIEIMRNTFIDDDMKLVSLKMLIHFTEKYKDYFEIIDHIELFNYFREKYYLCKFKTKFLQWFRKSKSRRVVTKFQYRRFTKFACEKFYESSIVHNIKKIYNIFDCYDADILLQTLNWHRSYEINMFFRLLDIYIVYQIFDEYLHEMWRPPNNDKGGPLYQKLLFDNSFSKFQKQLE